MACVSRKTIICVCVCGGAFYDYAANNRFDFRTIYAMVKWKEGKRISFYDWI